MLRTAVFGICGPDQISTLSAVTRATAVFVSMGAWLTYGQRKLASITPPPRSGATALSWIPASSSSICLSDRLSIGPALQVTLSAFFAFLAIPKVSAVIATPPGMFCSG